MYQIQEFSQKTGVSKRMLRYLEEQGLLVPDRRENEYRVYREDHFEQLHTIQFWQNLGFSLREIKSLETLTSSELEARISILHSKRKTDLENHINQMDLIRATLKKIKHTRGSDELKNLPELLNDLRAWTTDSREDFLTGLINPVMKRTIYGPFPEMDALSRELSRALNHRRAIIDSVDFMKFGECIQELGSGDVVVWESRRDYQYFFAHIPESLFFSEETPSQLEEELRSAFESALSQSFHRLHLENENRLLSAATLRHYVASVDICVRITLSLAINPGSNTFKITLLIPFLFIQTCRRGLNTDSAKLSRTLQDSLIQLTEQQIQEKMKEMKNEDYLLTILLSDSETRYKLFETLSDQAKQLVLNDLQESVSKLQRAWQK